MFIKKSYLCFKRIEKLGIKISNQQIVSPFVSKLWRSEPQEVRNHYKIISDQRRKLHKDQLMKYIPNDVLGKRKQSPDDDVDDDGDDDNETTTNNTTNNKHNKRQRLAE